MRRMAVALAFSGGMVCGIGGVSVCFAPAPASQAVATSAPAEDGQNLAEELHRLRAVVLGNPLDAAAKTKLVGLRERQQQLRRGALDGLATGLQAYLGGKRLSVRRGLSRAITSPWVVELADARLGSPLEEIVAATKADVQPEVCPLCGDTNEVDCKACNGTGYRQCSSCNGRGGRQQRSEAPGPAVAPFFICERCQGTGALPCTECKGLGVIPCPKCAALAAREAAGEVGPTPEAAKAIAKLVALARYLCDGGIDLYSPQALKRSPRMKK